jgi:hypothetical protein
MAITWVWDADSLSNGTLSHTNFPTQYELSKVSCRSNSGHYRFSGFSSVQVHGAPEEIKVAHCRPFSLFDKAVSLV